MYSSSLGLRLLRIWIELRYLLSSLKVCWQSSVNKKFGTFLSFLKNRRDLSTNLDTNLFRAIMRPVNLCTLLTQVGVGISSRAYIFAGLGSISLQLTMYPRNFPPWMKNAHFAMFNFILYCWSTRNTSFKFATCCSNYLLFTIISSTYTSTFFSIWFLNILFINLW